MQPLTRKYSETVKQDLRLNADFRRAYLAETINAMVEGELNLGKALLREYINGMQGFVALGDALGKSPKSLMRMLSPQGNPTARNLFEMITHLQKAEGSVLRLEAVAEKRNIAA